MSHDLDDALRSAMRRRAEDAPTYVDLDGVRDRAREIRRRRTVEMLAAGVVAVGVVLGLGAVVGTLRHDATPPPVTTQSPAPVSLPPMAYTRGDANAQPVGATQIMLRVNGAESVLTTTSSATTLLGWYGPDRRTLVWGTQAAGGFREAALYAVTVGDDGRATGAPAPLTIPGTGALGAGIPFVVAGGPIQLWVPTNPGDGKSPAVLMTISAELDRVLTRPLPAGEGPIAITRDHIAFINGDSRVTVAVLTLGGVSTRLRPIATCARVTGEATNLDGTAMALGCGGGTVDVVRLVDGNVTHLPAVPETNQDVYPLAMWWDPAGGIHAATTPTLRADYTVVHSWDWNGTTWAPGKDGVLFRAYPQGAPSVRYVKENASPGNNGRWVVESSPEVDLGPSGGSLAVR